jgi:CheY-like chemotaxis protein/glycine cleavage system H lipoate-binding protein
MSTGVKVLVVDDEEVVLLSIRKVFKNADYELDTVQSPQLGLAMMESRDYDIVITDLMMPGMNGLEFLERVRQMSPKTRVIMITGYATMRTALQSMRRGAFDFLAKPFTKEELNNVMHRAMQRGDMTQEAPTPESQGVSEGAGALEPGRLYTLRNHSWARIEPDLHVTIGVERAFLSTIGNIKGIELPEKGEGVTQAAGCARLLTSDGRSYSVWSPLSGRVLEVNKALFAEPAKVERDNRAAWLIRIDPTSIETEIEDLLS